MDPYQPAESCIARDQASFHSHDLLSQVLHKQALFNSFDSTNYTTETTQMQNSSYPAIIGPFLGVPDEYSLAVAAVLGLGKKRKGGSNKRKRKRSSQAQPIKVLTADASNFRHIVHSLTGFPQPQPKSLDRETSLLSGNTRTTLHLPSFSAPPLNRILPPPSHQLPFIPFNNTPSTSSLDAYTNGLAQTITTPSSSSSSPVLESLLSPPPPTLYLRPRTLNSSPLPR